MAPIPATTFDQSVAIEHGVDRADRRLMDVGIKSVKPFADLRRAPGRLLLLQAHDQRLNLKGKLVGLTVGSPGPVCQRFETAVVVTIKKLVTVLREMPNSRHASAIFSPSKSRAMNFSRSSMG